MTTFQMGVGAAFLSLVMGGLTAAAEAQSPVRQNQQSVREIETQDTGVQQSAPQTMPQRRVELELQEPEPGENAELLNCRPSEIQTWDRVITVRCERFILRGTGEGRGRLSTRFFEGAVFRGSAGGRDERVCFYGEPEVEINCRAHWDAREAAFRATIMEAAANGYVVKFEGRWQSYMLYVDSYTIEIAP